ncbi:hypothetical protein AAFF_G00381480 [Aldrovandia affinis]|uniref:Uncharacterized protein n=1 Tax=Aldrovandia affinis TaxID=143900 RepID=A0AAD7X039_9TELE|nr:hypothetical protein AAFF_G00381480 [Aldrovandia affinis]
MDGGGRLEQSVGQRRGYISCVNHGDLAFWVSPYRPYKDPQDQSAIAFCRAVLFLGCHFGPSEQRLPGAPWPPPPWFFPLQLGGEL